MRLIFESKVVLLLTFAIIAGCGDTQKQDTHANDDAVKSMEIPNSYAAAVEQCEILLLEIGELIQSSELSKVHEEAAKIRDIARKLPQLAKGSVPSEMLKDINIKSKELAGMFTVVDEAADAGDKEGTVGAYDVMQNLVDALKLHVSQNNKNEDQ